MGFRKKEKQYRLSFEGTELDGLVAVMQSVDVGTLLDFAELADIGNNLTTENMGKVGELFATLAENIDEWNYENSEGEPVPTTFEGVRTLELSEAVLLLREWITAMAKVPDPLDQRSNGGKPSPVADLPMEALSPSRAS